MGNGQGYHHCEDNEYFEHISDINFLLTNQNLLIFGHTLAVLCACVFWVRRQAQTENKIYISFCRGWINFEISEILYIFISREVVKIIALPLEWMNIFVLFIHSNICYLVVF